jgi:chromosome segregation ATPase
MRIQWLALLCLVACGGAEKERAEKERAQLAEVQKEADQKVAKAQQEAQQKVADAQKQIDDLKAELADTKSKLDEAQKNQSASGDQSKALAAALAKARQGFKEEGRVELAEVNRQVGEVSSKAGKVPQNSKAAFTKAMQQVVQQQKAVAKDLTEYDTANIEDFNKIKAKVTKDLQAMKTAVRSAKALVPAQ